MTDAAVVQIPRPKTPQNYDRGTTERAYQSIEQALQYKHDRRGHLYLEPGKELILTSDDSSAQFGIGLDAAGYIRLRDMSDGSIGTFSVAWAQVDGAAQEITNLQAYVDAADSTLTSSVLTNATAITANGASIAGIETEITAARDGETDLAAKFSSVEGAYAAADAAEAASRASLQATLEAADSALQANIDSEESARVTADAAEAAARASLQAALENADSALQANIDSEESARVTADVAEATAREAVQARAGRAIGSKVANPVFDLHTGGALPSGWGLFGTVATPARVTGKIGEYAHYMGIDGSVAGGIAQGFGGTIPASPGLYSVKFAVELAGGNYDGAGVVVQFWSTGLLATYNFPISTTPDTAGVTSSTQTGLRHFAPDPIMAPAGTTAIVLYAIGHDVSLGSIAGAIALSYHQVDVFPADSATALAEILREAFIDSNGSAYAGIRLVAAASGSDPAIVELTSADGAASVRLGGDTEIDGNLVVNGTITTEGLATNAVTNTENDQDDSALTPVNNTWTDVADFSFTSVGIGVQLRGSCEVDIFTDGTSPTAQVRILRGATVLKTSKVFAAVDAGSGFQKVEQSIALDYNDLPSSGTYTYKLQARLNEGTSAVVVSTFDVTNRFLSATELKR